MPRPTTREIEALLAAAGKVDPCMFTDAPKPRVITAGTIRRK
jgi:hypothetical protein